MTVKVTTSKKEDVAYVAFVVALSPFGGSYEFNRQCIHIRDLGRCSR